MIYSIHHAWSLSKYWLCMGNQHCYAFMVSKQQKGRSERTFLFPMEKAEAMDEIAIFNFSFSLKAV